MTALYILILIGVASFGIGADAYRRNTERTPIIVLWNIGLGLALVVYGVGMIMR